jgi:hypothetical protein
MALSALRGVQVGVNMEDAPAGVFPHITHKFFVANGNDKSQRMTMMATPTAKGLGKATLMHATTPQQQVQQPRVRRKTNRSDKQLA